MRRLADLFVIAAGCTALLAEIVLLAAAAYLQGGHPPASGIVALLVLVVQGPLSAVAAALGLSARTRETADGRKWLFVMTGVNLSFATFAVMFVVLKVMLGRSI